jgi:hypothetical protein
MAYGRDPDAHTRGVGAIAARDNAHPQAARARRLAKNRATVAHDRMMRTITYGPRGGISGLGALNLTNVGGGRATVSTKPSKGLSFDVPGRVDPLTGGMRPTAGGGAGGGGTTPPIRRPTTTVPGRVTGGVFTIDTSVPPLPPMVDPTSDITTGTTPPPPSRPAPRPSGPISVPAGGGIVPPPTKAPTPLPEPEEVELPEVPEGEAAPTVAGISTKTAMLVGAAALAAYFLLRKKRS